MATPAPQFDHANDFSWVTGTLEYQPLEGGCWTLKFSENPEDASQFFGILALELPDDLDVSTYDGEFVYVTGQVLKQKFSMSCPPTVYGVETIFLNNSP